MANPITNAKVQIMKVGIISLHIFEQPSSPKGRVTQEKIMIKPSKMVTIPKTACNQTTADWTSDKLLIKSQITTETRDHYENYSGEV